jgi:hypothetical protein
MHHDDSPKTNAHVTLLLGKYSLRERIVMKTKLNSKADENPD